MTFGTEVRADGSGGRCASARAGYRRSLALLAFVFLFAAPSLAAQELADFDYANLSFRGLGFEAGYVFPTRVESTYSLGVRMDLGYLGPGLRVVPGVTYWSSRMKRSEVEELETRVEQLVDREAPIGTPPASVSLGTIEWSDVAISADAHVVWRVPGGLLTYAGLGGTAHILNGGGEAIADTFIEDLLDTVTAGANIHVGLEYPVASRFRLYGVSRFEVTENFQYVEVRVGGQFMIGAPAPGEVAP